MVLGGATLFFFIAVARLLDERLVVVARRGGCFAVVLAPLTARSLAAAEVLRFRATVFLAVTGLAVVVLAAVTGVVVVFVAAPVVADGFLVALAVVDVFLARGVVFFADARAGCFDLAAF